MRTKLIDAATLLDDFIEQAGLDFENWREAAETIRDIDEGDAMMDKMRCRINEVFEPLPLHNLKVIFRSDGVYGPMLGKTQVKGKTPKMAIQMAILGLENCGVEYERVMLDVP